MHRISIKLIATSPLCSIKVVHRALSVKGKSGHNLSLADMIWGSTRAQVVYVSYYAMYILVAQAVPVPGSVIINITHVGPRPAS